VRSDSREDEDGALDFDSDAYAYESVAKKSQTLASSGAVKEDSTKARIKYPNGDIYEGMIRSLDSTKISMRDGKGKYICADVANKHNYEYHGQWENNKRDGQGRCYYYNGDLY